jgi:DNA-binding MarR family transcriptional regulator/N-acetylglutamate synthase-like GNAT family acetyltransferase
MKHPAISPALDQRASAVRAFNRFYTRRIGVLKTRHLDSPFSLTEVRVLYELAHRDRLSAATLAADLSLDPGYLSRLLGAFERRGLLARTPAPHDARQRTLALTAKGRRAFAPLDARAHAEMAAMLDAVPVGSQERIVEAMRTIESLLEPARAATIALRPPKAGDLGWVVQAHGALYAAEFGYDVTFEALVAGIVADFTRRFDAKHDACWIADRGGIPVGCVFVVRKSKTVAKLRLFLVDPAARGTGLGQRLVDECIRFARETGYRTLTLWTQSELLAARRLYERAGFRRVATERHRSFGHDLIGENWELRLQRRSR